MVINVNTYITLPQVGEQLDLMDAYVQKQFDNKLEKARKVLTQLGTKARTHIQTN